MCIAMQVDLNDPTSIPAALVGISTIVDCATARPEESAQKIDWDGKVALIQSAQVSPPATILPVKDAKAALAALVYLLLCHEFFMACCGLYMCASSQRFLYMRPTPKLAATGMLWLNTCCLWYCRQWAFSGTCSSPFTTATSTLRSLSCK